MTPTLYDTCRIARAQRARRDFEREMYEYAIRIGASFNGADHGFAFHEELQRKSLDYYRLNSGDYIQA